MRFDMRRYVGTHNPDRNDLRVWDTGESDLEGCVTLVDPKRLVPKSPLASPKAAILALTDVLDKDHTRVDKLVKHKSRSGLFYDARQLASKRTYLQVVMSARFASPHTRTPDDWSSLYVTFV